MILQLSYFLGDGRVNEHVGLMAMHTSFAREHNRIEEELHKFNPHWDGNRLFQESRRILIAEWQHLVYNEYLSLIFGPLITQQYELNLHASGYHNGKISMHNQTDDPPDLTSDFRTRRK